MKKTIIILALLISTSCSFSQVSGYMGKKFSVIYSAGVNFPYDIFNKELIPTLNHTVAIEYIYGNNSAVGLSYKYANRKKSNSLFIISKPKYSLTSHTFGTYIKFYNSKTLAPIGLYGKLGFAFQYLQLKDKAVFFNNQTQYVFSNKNQFDVLFNVGLGRNWILFDRLLLGFHGEVNMPFVSFAVSFLGTDNDKEKIELNRFNYLNEIFRLSLNFGILAF